LFTASAESVRNNLDYSLQSYYQLVVLPHRHRKESKLKMREGAEDLAQKYQYGEEQRSGAEVITELGIT
jgi:hypothetical protein